MEEKFKGTLSGKLRACLGCSQIKTLNGFRKDGCENCPMLNMKGNVTNVSECTSSKFKGVVALLQPSNSWVGKWQRIGEFRKGLYAMVVEGALSEDFIKDLEQHGRIYYERTESFTL
ncbi:TRANSCRIPTION INITIATION PROTEIN [Encephalitozoon cuniculi GB-M1]|uniref:Transcription elongation factor SPT4 n=2 Tax=Encephalitozoon cuniculi TaxID=6035 RepID=Q8SR92_ENCCU|nr:transcription elongation factor SPT4 [Encephalitozoon cuniculi GB-M1]AGE95183.1 transcription initiation protein [Encephalitozoon cuniculi]KMV65693.1 transcription elongation factor SPT4 [Encephalitozoon cuniculi EcunIII-L]UYI27099.1 transcription elongation factor Spt4 [Encephalitozoon cuniculi]CAD26470.1 TRANSCRIPTION INITIATION PROTEIN [Encephalitozoon cuniculi GB-M1]